MLAPEGHSLATADNFTHQNGASNIARNFRRLGVQEFKEPFCDFFDARGVLFVALEVGRRLPELTHETQGLYRHRIMAPLHSMIEARIENLAAEGLVVRASGLIMQHRSYGKLHGEPRVETNARKNSQSRELIEDLLNEGLEDFAASRRSRGDDERVFGVIFAVAPTGEKRVVKCVASAFGQPENGYRIRQDLIWDGRPALTSVGHISLDLLVRKYAGFR